jgi:hypothetical protein
LFELPNWTADFWQDVYRTFSVYCVCHVNERCVCVCMCVIWKYMIVFDIHVTVHCDKFRTIKPTRCTDFSNIFLKWNATCFGHFPCPSSGVFPCTHGNDICHTGDSLQARCQQTCMTYTIAVCTVKNSWWRTGELSETCSVSFQEYSWEISASSWFYCKKYMIVCDVIDCFTWDCCGERLSLSDHIILNENTVESQLSNLWLSSVPFYAAYHVIRTLFYIYQHSFYIICFINVQLRMV